MKRIWGILTIVIAFLTSCEMESNGRFFPKEKHENELNQSANIDLLERIKNDSTIRKDEMIFTFYFITDKRRKVDSLVDYLEKYEQNQQIIELNQINEIWELRGRTYPIKLEIDSINDWERRMWDIGYKFDCKLDGWETTFAN